MYLPQNGGENNSLYESKAKSDKVGRTHSDFSSSNILGDKEDKANNTENFKLEFKLTWYID